MNKPQINEVFRPNSMPSYTYINRLQNHIAYEKKLQRALEQPGKIVSIVGGSKTGKTVLFRKVVAKEKLVEISGSQIGHPEDFWKLIAEKLNLPNEISVMDVSNETNGENKAFSSKISFVGFVGFDISRNDGKTEGKSENITKKITLNNTVIMQILIDNGYVLVIDDFHYINTETQKYLARTLKAEIFNGLKAILLSLPHRSDDIIKRNPDLIGRVAFIELTPWTREELREIASKGFEFLGMKLTEEILSYIAEESAVSPQLMQENCLNLAYLIEDNNLTDVSKEDVQTAFKETAQSYPNYIEVFENVLRGPTKGKSKRKQYALSNGKSADIYEVILLAIALDPPELKISIENIKKRVASIIGEAKVPPNPNFIQHIGHAERIIKKSLNNADTIEWKNSALYVIDPFLLFFLRWDDSWK